MSKIPHRISDVLCDYTNNEITKEEFKQKIIYIESNTEGMNRQTFLSSVNSEMDRYCYNRGDYIEIVIVLDEIYPNKDLSPWIDENIVNEVRSEHESGK